MFKEYIYTKETTDFTKLKVKEFNNNPIFTYEKFECEICSSKKFKTFFTNDRYEINQDTGICLNCGFFFSNPRLSNQSSKLFYNLDYYRMIYQKSKIFYDNDLFYNDTLNTVKNHKFIEPKKPNFDYYYKNLYFDFINYYIKDFKTVLDIGCGKGLKLMDFKTLGKEVYGIEPSQTYNKVHNKMGINSKVGFIDVGLH